ncbi:hypothetical protein BgiBS90_028909, partial [Biomphalaria glabrata]
KTKSRVSNEVADRHRKPKAAESGENNRVRSSELKLGIRGPRQGVGSWKNRLKEFTPLAGNSTASRLLKFPAAILNFDPWPFDVPFKPRDRRSEHKLSRLFYLLFSV